MTRCCRRSARKWDTSGAKVCFDSNPTAGITASTDLLGRGSSHWSFFHNTASATSSTSDPKASSLEGNYWAVNTPSAGNFQTQTVTDGFSYLDLYLMGLVSASEVPTFWYIDNSCNTVPGTGVTCASLGCTRCAGSSPKAGVQTGGTQTFVNVNDIEGARVPSFANSPKIFRQAFILLTLQGADATQGELDQIETFRKAWKNYLAEETLNRGAVVTILDDVVFVDGANTGSEDGSVDDPYKTVVDGRDNVPCKGTIIIKGGSYEPEGLTFSTAATIRAVVGSVIIGK